MRARRAIVLAGVVLARVALAGVGLGGAGLGGVGLGWVVLPASAHASSLVFVGRDGNVWQSGADGTEQLQVTTDGSRAKPYFSPTQSVRGAIEVARGAGLAGRIFRLNRDGRRASPPFAVNQAPAIADPVLSPDGRRVALWTVSLADVAVPCYSNFYCFEVSNAFRYNQITRPAWMTFQHPAWLGNSRLLLFSDNGALAYADLTKRGYQPWFSWSDYHPAADGLGEWIEGAASLDGRELALVTHENRLGRFAIQLFAGRMDVGGADLSTYRPAPRRCELTAPDGAGGADPRRPGLPAFNSLSFSPHGTALAFGFKGAIYVANLARCTARKVIAGGSDPFWGPANVPTPALSMSVGRPSTIGALVSHGFPVTVRLSVPGRIALALTERRRTLARAIVKVSAHRARTVVVRPGSAIARRLTGLKQLHATLVASVVGFRRPVQSARLTFTGR